MNEIQVQVLTAERAEQLRALRIRAATEYPASFSASPEDEAAISVEQLARQLADGPPNSYVLGALADGALVGVVSLMRYLRPKVAHKAMLGGMYVAPEFQGSGVGGALLTATFDLARTLPGLETLTLAVTAGNAAARALYLRAGFIGYGVEPRYIRVGDTYYNIEWMYCHLAPH